jgi:hypothetical protein
MVVAASLVAEAAAWRKHDFGGGRSAFWEARRQRGGSSSNAAVAAAALWRWAAWQRRWQLGGSSLAAAWPLWWQRQRGGNSAAAGSLTALTAAWRQCGHSGRSLAVTLPQLFSNKVFHLEIICLILHT